MSIVHQFVCTVQPNGTAGQAQAMGTPAPKRPRFTGFLNEAQGSNGTSDGPEPSN